ncbi:hypothetical protein AP13_04073 [Mycobacterium tuberculosis M2142]|nr:hypothetical protein AP13_04073 [Mycobacterium tuberculosis M2142]
MGYLLPARGDAVRGRQTQNPERGRKLLLSNGGGNLAATGRSSDPKPREGTETWDICCPPGEMLSEVVRPKTPRGDGNLRQPFRCDADGRLGSSDPKPREGTETCANPFGVMRMVGSGRQTQNPERGRKHSHEFPSAS